MCIYWQTETPQHNPGALFPQKPMSPASSPYAKPKPSNQYYIYYYTHAFVCVFVFVGVRKTEISRGNFRETLDFIYIYTPYLYRLDL